MEPHLGYQSSSSQNLGAAQVSRRDIPATLTFGCLTALLSGLLSAAGAALLMVGARGLVAPTARDILGPDVRPQLDTNLTSAVVDELATTRVTHGIIALIAAMVVLGVAPAVRNGARWSRITLAVVLSGSLCADALAISDVAPTSTTALHVAAMALSVAVVALLHAPDRRRGAWQAIPKRVSIVAGGISGPQQLER
jgi:hypothetical protein